MARHSLRYAQRQAPEKNQKKLDKVHFVKVVQGEKQKIQGDVSIRSGDSFKVRDPWRRRDFRALDGNHERQLAQLGS